MSVESEEPKDLSEEDKRRNLQVNYFIMRQMWQVIRGRSAYKAHEGFDSGRAKEIY